jgi:predicted metal-dependent phosphoesterase TrpH
MNGYADLHLHTIASDGTCTLAETVRRAREHGIFTVAITDHDVVADGLSGRVTSENGVEVITGVEIKSTFQGVAGEILGYFADPHHEELRAMLDALKRSRVDRMQRMVEFCCEQAGAAITFDDVRAVGPGNVGRPHLARVLIDRGLVDSYEQAFAEWLGKGRPCYVSIDKPDYREVIRIVHAAGGVASLAHPCLMTVGGWDRFLDELAAAGLDGLEVFYPYRASNGIGRGLTIAPGLMRTIAEKRGFLLTGGSDDHGPNSTKESMGTIRIPYERVAALKAALPVPL